MIRVLVTAAALFLLVGCATSGAPADPFAGMRTGEGTVRWQEEYEFSPMPEPWRLLQLDEEDYSIAFFRACDHGTPGNYPCESIVAYAEEPFGYSRDLDQRQKEFFRRFLWAARIDFDEPRVQRVRALEGEALQADTIGHERVLRHEVLVRVVFARRGERVVAFYFTQWRPSDREFDRAPMEDFHRFIESFGYLKPSFYQRLQ
jgi:hypothetical protein